MKERTIVDSIAWMKEMRIRCEIYRLEKLLYDHGLGPKPTALDEIIKNTRALGELDK